MNFEFTEEQKLFPEAVHKFAVAELEAEARGSVEILKNRIAEEIFDRRFDQRGRQADAAE
jgi:hypothetical protein